MVTTHLVAGVPTLYNASFGGFYEGFWKVGPQGPQENGVDRRITKCCEGLYEKHVEDVPSAGS